MATIEPQLRALGAGRTLSYVASSEFWKTKVDDLTEIFTEAIALSGLLRSCPHHYEHAWFHFGAEIDTTVMEQPHESDRAGKVKFCACPAVFFRDGKDGEHIVVCKADVLRLRN